MRLHLEAATSVRFLGLDTQFRLDSVASAKKRRQVVKSEFFSGSVLYFYFLIVVNLYSSTLMVINFLKMFSRPTTISFQTLKV